MFLGFGRDKKLARYKRFHYEPRVFDAESDSFKLRRKIIQKQVKDNQEPLSLEKETFLLSKRNTNKTSFILFVGFMIGAIGFYHFYNLVKTDIGPLVSIMGNTWGSNEIGQFTCLAILLSFGYLFIKKSKKL